MTVVAGGRQQGIDGLGRRIQVEHIREVHEDVSEAAARQALEWCGNSEEDAVTALVTASFKRRCRARTPSPLPRTLFLPAGSGTRVGLRLQRVQVFSSGYHWPEGHLLPRQYQLLVWGGTA